MDPITAAIVAALGAGVLSGLTDTSKTALSDSYHALKTLLARKFDRKSEVVQAIDRLEAKPDSTGRLGTLQEEIVGINAIEDAEILDAAKHLLTLVQAKQVGTGKFTIQNNALVQGQTVGDRNTITQQFGDPPRT